MQILSSKREKTQKFPTLATLLIISVLTATVLFPNVLSEGVIAGMRLAALRVLPSVFPFFIISDAIASISIRSGGFLSRLFSRLTGLPECSFRAFLFGAFLGFPIGVRLASDMYEHGSITRNEAERLIAVSNTPSFAFVFSAVGMSLLGSLKLGIFLFLTVVISSLLTATVFRAKKQNRKISDYKVGQSFDFVNSVKNAGFASLTVSSYIIFFSALTALIRHVLGNGLIGLTATAILEVSGGVSEWAKTSLLQEHFKYALIAATLSFSGISVGMQAKSVAHRDLSFKKYYLLKTFSAAVSFLLVFLIISFA